MAVQYISKPPIRIELPLISHHHHGSPVTFITTKFTIFCAAKIAAPPTKPGKGVVTQFLVNKYCLTEETINKAFRHCAHTLHSPSTQNMEQVISLLQDHGFTPAHIRKVVIYNPRLLFLDAQENVKAKLNFLKTFMKEKDMAKLIGSSGSHLQNSLENRIKPAVSFLQKCGFEGEDLSLLVATVPLLLTFSDKNVLRLFKEVEDLGFTKGSKMFVSALRVIARISEDSVQQKKQYFCSIGFSEEQVLFLCKRFPNILGISKEKINRHMDFLINSAGLTFSEIAMYPHLLGYSLERRIIPRYRVFEALKSMGLVKSSRCFPAMVFINEVCFLAKYVNAHAESSVLLDIYKGASNGGLMIKRDFISEDSLLQKTQYLCSLGFSEEQVLTLCRRFPDILGISKEKIIRHMDFLVNTAGLPLSKIAMHPNLLRYSLERRIIPRYRVFAALKSKALVKSLRSFPPMVFLSEGCFLEKYVNAHAESSVLLDIYKGGSDCGLMIERDF